MYIEKDFLIDKINEFCKHRNIEMSYDEKDMLATSVSRVLDKERLLTFEEFVELLDHNAEIEQYKNIEFDDEIISIEECGYIDMIDFDVSGNKLFFADGILTHNSSTNSIDEVDNSNVSDSMGTVMTADFMLFLLQNEEMKEKKEIVCKITKNRFAGRTDTWLMNIDYEHMRFADMLIQNAGSDIVSDVDSILGVTRAPAVNNDDFGVITATKQKAAEEYAASEIKQIVREDVQKVREAQKDRADNSKPDPFNSDIDKLYAELGI